MPGRRVVLFSYYGFVFSAIAPVPRLPLLIVLLRNDIKSGALLARYAVDKRLKYLEKKGRTEIAKVKWMR